MPPPPNPTPLRTRLRHVQAPPRHHRRTRRPLLIGGRPLPRRLPRLDQPPHDPLPPRGRSRVRTTLTRPQDHTTPHATDPTTVQLIPNYAAPSPNKASTPTPAPTPSPGTSLTTKPPPCRAPRSQADGDDDQVHRQTPSRSQPLSRPAARSASSLRECAVGELACTGHIHSPDRARNINLTCTGRRFRWALE